MGKGFDLASVLGSVPYSGTGREEITYIRRELLDGDENNFYQLSDLEGLAENIALCGLQQPIRVRRKGEDRYVIVSGHRRRAAIDMLAEEDPLRWQEIACIIEEDEASPALQQLRLIYANANTRTMTSWEISQQTDKVTELLYQLKEEGYEFPGRMRDHVAEAVGVSKSKLSRLKVIRDNLMEKFLPDYQSGKLTEDTAYRLSQLPAEDQELFWTDAQEGKSIWGNDVSLFRDRTAQLTAIPCEQGGTCCNLENKRMAAFRMGRYEYFPCDKCCSECPRLKTCRYACPKMAERVQAMKAEDKARRKQELEEQAARELPRVQLIQNLWVRFGELRRAAGKSVKDTFEAVKVFYGSNDDKRYRDLERGTVKVTDATGLPYGYSVSISDVQHLIALADLFDCSLDELLCRDRPGKVPNSGTGWQTGFPVNLGKYMLLLDRGEEESELAGDVFDWRGDGWYQYGCLLDEEYDGKVLAWCPLPEEVNP